MARIRTIKPEFFRHEGLQDLERLHPGKCPMLVFAGLFGHCDKGGVFEWKPRSLKLDILPFLDFDMVETLELLKDAGQIQQFEHEGKFYGVIPTFTEHQSIGGKESQAPVKFPRPNGETTGKERGSNREATETAGREGKGREGKGREPAAACGYVDKSGVVNSDCDGQNSPLSDPSSRRNGSGSRRNGDFESINQAISKLLASGVCKASDTAMLAKLADVTEPQAAHAVRQLRDRGRLPAVAA